MKQYKGQLAAETKTLISQNKERLTRLTNRSLGLSKAGNNDLVYTLDQSLAKYNPGLSIDEIKAWVWYRRKNNVPMENWSKYFSNPSDSELAKWVNKSILFFDDGDLVPYPIFIFGNLHKKIAAVNKNKDIIVANYGDSVYVAHLQLLKSKMPRSISLSNPSVSERPVVLAISEYARTFHVSSIKDADFSEPITLQHAFINWLRVQSDGMFKKVRPMEIINIYLNGEKKPRNTDPIEWNSKKKQTRDEGEMLFKVFLHEAIEFKDQQRIDLNYNENYNAYAPLEVGKIPVALQVSKKFKGFPLNIAPAQAEGVAFIELVGSGIIAYDVGVGKTITAIINIINAINSGKCKRPLIAVPNPTYKNWLLEILGNSGSEGILSNTGVTINDWYNLGVNVKANLSKKVAERSITVVSYEGFEKLGFDEKTAEDHLNELADILDQTDISERELEKSFEKYRSMIGTGNKGTIADFETLGFDFLVIDEAHNFKNVFAGVKSEKGQAKQFNITGGQPSKRGIKAFFICNYVQRQFGRNVVLLTATPFTNSPLEIYSMMSLVAFDYMKKMGIYNIRYFFEQFIQETSEYGIKQNGEIEYKDVVKSFNNRISLQQLVFSHMSFKTGEEANVPRPCKINLPKTTKFTEKGIEKLDVDKQILTYLKQSDLQKENQQLINSRASEPVSKEDAGKLLSLMAESLNNAFSPFLVGRTPKSYVSVLERVPKDYVEFVEESPKIFYTIKCIETVKAYHEKRNEPVSGQVIYSDRGKDYFPLIKKYLEEKIGYKTGQKMISNPKLKVDEVSIISGGMTADEKEKIKDAFNEGICKVIIGTSTIKEGINLQEKSTVLYNLLPDWNPTGIKQLEGRIWRQKNMFAFVRIVMPLMENSMDIFIFQKLEEKTARINELLSKTDGKNVLDEESLDPNEVKFALVTDLGVLQRFEIKQIGAELTQKAIVLKSNLEDLTQYSFYKQRLDQLANSSRMDIIQAKNSFGELNITYSPTSIYYEQVSSIDIEKQTKEVQSKIERYKKVFDALTDVVQNYEHKAAIKAMRMYANIMSRNNGQLDVYAEVLSKYTKIFRTIFEQRGYAENTDLDVIKAEMSQELILVESEIEQLRTPEFQDAIMVRIQEQKEKYQVKGGELEDRVKDFAALNYLMSYKYDINKQQCDIPIGEAPKETKVKEVANSADSDAKAKKMRFLTLKAKAIKIKLLLLAS